MQTHDAPADIIFKLWPWLEANRNRLIGGVVVGFILVGAYSFNSWRLEQKEVAAGEALTKLLTVPPASTTPAQQADSLVKFAADNAGTGAGKRAQLQGASALFDAGRYADAETEFKKFLAANSSGTLAATAQLGVAASLEAQGKNDLAAAAYAKVGASDPTASAAAQSAKTALARLQSQKPAAQPAAKS